MIHILSRYTLKNNLLKSDLNRIFQAPKKFLVWSPGTVIPQQVHLRYCLDSPFDLFTIRTVHCFSNLGWEFYQGSHRFWHIWAILLKSNTLATTCLIQGILIAYFTNYERRGCCCTWRIYLSSISTEGKVCKPQKESTSKWYFCTLHEQDQLIKWFLSWKIA